MDFESYDVLIVGGGLAGIRAAIAVVEANPRLKIAMVSKVYPMRSHTVSAEGGAAAVLRPEDSYENHSFDTIKGSDYLADQDVIEAFVRGRPVELIQMEHWGCPWSRDPDGKISARPFGGMTTWRTCFAADKTGFHMPHTLFATPLKFERIHARPVRRVNNAGKAAGYVGQNGNYIPRDVRRMGQKHIDEKLRFMRELGLDYM